MSESISSKEKVISPSASDGEIQVNRAISLDDSHLNYGGAAVEDVSPLGAHNFGWFSVICLNISQMIGTGIFSTPGTLLASLGSVGLVLIYWVIGGLISWAGLAYYLELGSYFPNRGGAEVVYLEQAWRKPKYLLPASFAACTIITSFSASNCIVFASYIFSASGISPTSWQSKGLGVAAYTVAILAILISTKWSARLSNVLSVIKTVLLLFVAITGLVVLGGKTSVQNPTANFQNAFAGTTSNGNNVAVALTKIIFSYAGWNNAHNFINEVKGGTKTLRWASPVALGVVFILYFFANIAYFAAVPLDQIRTGGTLVAAKFFTAVFGSYAGTKVLPVFVALSAFGNLIAVAIGQTRVIREVARQGVLPFASFWTSTRPFNTPAGPLLIKWGLTVIVILAVPSGDAFTFVVDLQSYPTQMFAFVNVVGVWLIRRHRKAAGFGKPEYQAWNIALIFSAAVSVFLLVMPWVPPAGGINAGDVSFFYASYTIAGVGIIAFCIGVWALYFKLLPRWLGYTLREEVVRLQNGELSKHFVKDYSRGYVKDEDVTPEVREAQSEVDTHNTQAVDVSHYRV